MTCDNLPREHIAFAAPGKQNSGDKQPDERDGRDRPNRRSISLPKWKHAAFAGLGAQCRHDLLTKPCRRGKSRSVARDRFRQRTLLIVNLRARWAALQMPFDFQISGGIQFAICVSSDDFPRFATIHDRTF